MNKSICWCLLVVAMGACIGLSLCMVGCEDASGVEGLTITPATATLSLDVNTVELTVTAGTGNGTNAMASAAGAIDLSLPLAWSVSDTSLGNIAESSGYTAIYARTSKNGDNIVTARDQYENEGHVAIKQVTDLSDDSTETSATTTTTSTTTTTLP